MTSGNLSEKPIETDDALAWEHLVAAGIADALLGNDRAILVALRRLRGTRSRRRRYARAPRTRICAQPLPLPALDGIRPACSPAVRNKKPRLHSREKRRTARRPVLCRSISAMLKTARLSMLGTPRARAWKISLTWRPPPWHAICTPVICRANGRASRHGAQSAAYRSPAPSCAHRERHGRGDCRRPAYNRRTCPWHRL